MWLAFEEDGDSKPVGRTVWESFPLFLRLFLAEYSFELSLAIFDRTSVESSGDSFDVPSVRDDVAVFSFPSSQSSSY